MPVRSRLRVQENGFEHALGAFFLYQLLNPCQLKLTSPFRGTPTIRSRSGRAPHLRHENFADFRSFAGVLPGTTCIFIGKLLQVPFIFGVPRAVSVCFCTWSVGELVSLLQRNIQSLRNLHHNAPDTLPPDYVADFSVLLSCIFPNNLLRGCKVTLSMPPFCPSEVSRRIVDITPS